MKTKEDIQRDARNRYVEELLYAFRTINQDKSPEELIELAESTIERLFSVIIDAHDQIARLNEEGK